MTAATPPAGIILSASKPTTVPRFIASAPGAKVAGYSPTLGGRAKVESRHAAAVLDALNNPATAPRFAQALLADYIRKWACSHRIKAGMKAGKK